MNDGDWAQGPEWDRFVAHQREHTVKAMQESAYVMSLIPEAGKVDIKFAVELGMAIMLDKPILALVQPGTPVPPGIWKIATGVIVADLDTESGRDKAARGIKEFMAKIGGNPA
jgi:hypothetical protein